MEKFDISKREAPLSLSVIVPLHYEFENLPMLYEKVTTAIQATPKPSRSRYELMLVDDGSAAGQSHILHHLESSL